MDQKQAREMSDDDLFAAMGEVRTDHYYYNVMSAEVQRRQFNSQMAALEAQRRAADSEKSAADAAIEGLGVAARNASYLFWSVVIAAGSAVVTAVGIAFNVFSQIR
jgi:hypothetical protein